MSTQRADSITEGSNLSVKTRPTSEIASEPRKLSGAKPKLKSETVKLSEIKPASRKLSVNQPQPRKPSNLTTESSKLSSAKPRSQSAEASNSPNGAHVRFQSKSKYSRSSKSPTTAVADDPPVVVVEDNGCTGKRIGLIAVACVVVVLTVVLVVVLIVVFTKQSDEVNVKAKGLTSSTDRAKMPSDPSNMFTTPLSTIPASTALPRPTPPVIASSGTVCFQDDDKGAYEWLMKWRGMLGQTPLSDRTYVVATYTFSCEDETERFASFLSISLFFNGSDSNTLDK